MSEETAKKSSGLAIAGLVLGILAAITSFLPIINNLSFFVAILGGVFAVIALVGAMRGKNDSKGLAIAGVVLAVVSCVVVLATQSAYSKAIDSAVDEMKSGEKPVAASTKNEEEGEEKAEKKDEKKESSKKESKTEAEPEPESEPEPEPEPEEDYSSMSVGQTVTLENGLAITVNSFSRTTRSYSDEELVCANVTYVNNGDKSVSFNTYDWKSENENGAEQYSTYSSDDDQLDSGKLKAGGTVTGNVYFEGDAIKVLYYSNIFQDDSSIGWMVS